MRPAPADMLIMLLVSWYLLHMGHAARGRVVLLLLRVLPLLRMLPLLAVVVVLLRLLLRLIVARVCKALHVVDHGLMHAVHLLEHLLQRVARAPTEGAPKSKGEHSGGLARHCKL